MVSLKHEGLLSLFHNRPTLAPELLQGPLGLKLPAWSEAMVEPSELNQVAPTEYRADLVIRLRQDKNELAIVVEAQLSRDRDKHESWPVYLTSLRARLHCPCVLLVVAPDASIARWCARPIELGHPDFVLKPLVAGPQTIPIILGQQPAGHSPEMAVLSTLAHGHDPELAPGLVDAVVSSAQGLDSERYTFYVDLALSALDGVVRAALEAKMRSGNYEYQSELVRELVGQGMEKGMVKGREEGQLIGRIQGERTAILRVLKARGLEVDDATRHRIEACTQLEQLERWVDAAATAQSIQDLFK